MPISPDDQKRVVDPLLRDLHATIGSDHDEVVRHELDLLLEYVDDIEWFGQRLVEDTQQVVHDQFIDTDWPRCPLHHRHPLWLHDGAWWCEQDNVRVAALGELGATPRPLA